MKRILSPQQQIFISLGISLKESVLVVIMCKPYMQNVSPVMNLTVPFESSGIYLLYRDNA